MEEGKAKSSTAIYHVWGIALVVAVFLIVRHVYQTYMFGGSTVQSSQWQLGLGLAGGALVVALVVFPFRRRMRQGAAGKLEPWMIGHSYLGLAAGIVLLHHGFFHFSFDLRGILLSFLMITLLLGVIVLFLRWKQEAKVESALLKKMSLYHRFFSILTGVLLVVHVLFDAVIRQ